MAVNESLAQFSDLAFEWALAGYVVALVCLGIEFALGRGRTPTDDEAASAALRAGRREQTRRGHGAASSSVGVLDPAVLDPSKIGHIASESTAGGPPPWGVRFGRAGTLVLVIGFIGHLTAIVTRGLAAHRVPWGNMMELSSMLCAFGIAGLLLVVFRSAGRYRPIGFFVLIPVVILMYVAQSALYAAAGTLVPALHSYWLVIHVLAVSLSGGVLMLSSVASLLYLLRRRYDRKVAADENWKMAHPDADADSQGNLVSAGKARAVAQGSRLAILPSLATLDRIAYRSAIVAFPVFTFAVIAGAMWAEVAWGRYWGWDPKETCSFITWVLYAAYLHARSTAGWRGARAAWISVLAFVSMMFNLFVINLVVSGLHSYAGLN